MATIQKKENGFYLIDGNVLVGEINYWLDDDGYMIANHTYVNPDFRGQKIAEQLLDALVDYARKEKRKIIPVCSYVVRSFESKEKYEDVWEKRR